MAQIVNPFRQLLNHISHELSRQNLRSLLHICAPYVPEYRREDIHCGLDLFECLIHWNIIGEDLNAMHNLLDFMRKMRPKRKDIIRTVKQYIRDHYEQPCGIESSVETYCSAARGHTDNILVTQPYIGSQHAINQSQSPSTPLLSTSGDDQYSWCCICFDCKCVPRPVPNCFLVFTSIVCLILMIFASIIWFHKKPSSWYEALGEAKSPGIGGGVVAVLALFILGLIVLYVKRLMSVAHQGHQLPVHHCSSVEFPNSSMTSGSVRSIPWVINNRYKKRRRSSTSSAPIGSVTTFDSRTTSHPIPTTVSIPPNVTTQMSYPDGCNGNIFTEEDGTSVGDYTASGEESESPTAVSIR